MMLDSTQRDATRSDSYLRPMPDIATRHSCCCYRVAISLALSLFRPHPHPHAQPRPCPCPHPRPFSTSTHRRHAVTPVTSHNENHSTFSVLVPAKYCRLAFAAKLVVGYLFSRPGQLASCLFYYS